MTRKTIDQYFHNLNFNLCTFHCSKTFVKMQIWLLNHEKIIHTNFDNEIKWETVNTEKYSDENNIQMSKTDSYLLYESFYINWSNNFDNKFEQKIFKKTYFINPVNKALNLLTLCAFLQTALLQGSILLIMQDYLKVRNISFLLLLFCFFF